jgi:hypothetical protein
VKSIDGLNSSGYGSFGEGEPISARALNRMAIGIDKNRTGLSQGLQFQANNNGTVYNDIFVTQVDVSSQQIVPKEQFQILINGDRLAVIIGTVLWAAHNFGNDAEGNPTVTCSNQTLIPVYGRYTGDNVVNGTDNNGYMQEGGYVNLTT